MKSSKLTFCLCYLLCALSGCAEQHSEPHVSSASTAQFDWVRMNGSEAGMKVDKYDCLRSAMAQVQGQSLIDTQTIDLQRIIDRDTLLKACMEAKGYSYREQSYSRQNQTQTVDDSSVAYCLAVKEQGEINLRQRKPNMPDNVYALLKDEAASFSVQAQAIKNYLANKGLYSLTANSPIGIAKTSYELAARDMIEVRNSGYAKCMEKCANQGPSNISVCVVGCDKVKTTLNYKLESCIQ